MGSQRKGAEVEGNMADQHEIPADTPEGLKAYLLWLEARVATLERRVYEPDEAYMRVEEGQKPLRGI